MKKEEFLGELRKKLAGLPKEDIENRVSFYDEMISDMVDDGKSEEEAINSLGGVDGVVNEIAKDTPLVKLVKERYKPSRKLTGFEIFLLVLGFPLWFPLLMVFLSLCLVCYILVWVLVIVSYAVEAGLIGGAVATGIAFFAGLFAGGFNIMTLGTLLFSIGASCLFIFACIGATKLTLKFSKRILVGIKSSFIKKGRNE